MQINTLKIKYPGKIRKRVGRGGKKGTYSGKGNKGQKARSGVSISPLFEGGRSSLVDRMKKTRGFKSFKSKSAIIKLSDLEKKFKEDDIINKESLVKTGLLNKKSIRGKIKILGGESIKRKIKIEGNIEISNSAKKFIQIDEKNQKKIQAKK